ncbi:ribosomal protein S6 kinase alpha-1-like [Paramacrobiotus metropolitanus]|uniref:ribosomal protein S6 kinase alpha-1-like n=1 Tax=Paramacrobiotus metropolitanus TaxID=2943436 RepID=UPI00244580A4|nr:ribosomal protein S6 kinase alpha-1-like [Paramacrobiotus metropolitanus]
MSTVEIGSGCTYTYDKDNFIKKGVYKAQTTARWDADPGGPSTLAIKVVRWPKQAFANQDLVDHCQRLINLNDANVAVYRKVTLRVTSIGATYLEFAMDYYAGGNLKDFISSYENNDSSLPAKALYDWSKQMASGLKYLHQRGIIHGSLKPGCILLDRSPDRGITLRIARLDRHIALQAEKTMSSDVKRMRNLIRICTRSSTSTFMSPEMLTNLDLETRDIVGRKTDVWSLGEIAVELGRCCFREKEKVLYNTETKARIDVRDMSSVWRSMRTVQGYSPEIPDTVPGDFARRILQFCIARNPANRYGTEKLHTELLKAEHNVFGKTWKHHPENQNEYDHHEAPRETESERDVSYPIVEEVGYYCEYEINFPDGFLGQGNFGAVFKATITQRSNGKGDNDNVYTGPREVAVKTVYVVDRSTRDRLRNEHTLRKEKERWGKLVKLRHPHLMAYYKFVLSMWRDNAKMDIVMNYCQAGDLSLLIEEYKSRGNALTVPKMITMTAHISSGLQYLHENNFIHADLKPANVFFSGQSGPGGCLLLVIGDLDNSVLIRNGYVDPVDFKMIQFTVGYMSPELAQALCFQLDDQYLERTDIWSLGCVMLDLANCCCMIKETHFSRGDNDTDFIRQSDDPQEEVFLNRIAIGGYKRHISKEIGQEEADIIRACLTVDSRQRITARAVFDKLRLMMGNFSQETREKTFGRGVVNFNFL